MTCDVISTGGKSGNAVLLSGFLLFDCGVPWVRVSQHARDIALVFLTHLHRDHFNASTLHELHRRRPQLRFVCGINTLTELVTVAHIPIQKIILAEPDCWKKIHVWPQNVDVHVRMFNLIHDVENVGWIVRIEDQYESGTAMYATDTHHIPITAPGLDMYMIEANYTEQEIQERMAAKEAAGVFAYEPRAKATHMSLERAVEWLEQNADPVRSRIVFLHGHIGRQEDNHDSMDSSIQQHCEPSKDDETGG